MCFSPEASFTVGTVLLPPAAYCLKQAVQKNPRFLALAAIPLGFSLQQFSEGFVWLGVRDGNGELATTASIWYLFFAIAFWPFWIPFSIVLTEPERTRKFLIGLLALISLGWGIFMYYPLAANPEKWLRIEVIQHSLHYAYRDLPIFQIMPPLATKLLYLICIAAPLIICSGEKNLYFGLMVAGLALISQLVFSHAFVSVWCFFAAFISFALCKFFRGLQTVSAPMSCVGEFEHGRT